MEKLQSHPAYTADLLPTGLKPITTKQFVSIISFFMKSVIGNPRGNRIANTNIEDIVQWLSQIHYPYMQSRSWLKTPNVPHALTHLLDLMQWLCYFIVVDSEDQIPTFRKDEFYINSYMSAAFVDVVTETFILWNNNNDKDQQDKNQDRLINEYVHRRIGIPTAKEATKKTKKINSEISKLRKERMEMCPKQKALLESQQCKQQKLQIDEQKHKTLLKEKKKSLHHLDSEYIKKKSLIKQLEETKQQLNVQIQQQSMSKKDFDTLLELWEEKRNRNKAKRDTNAHLAGIEYKRKLANSQQMKQMSECVAKLNMFVHEISEILQMSDLQQLCVDTKSEVLQSSLTPILLCLEDMVAKNLSSHDELSALSSQLRCDLQQVNDETRAVQSQLELMTKRCADLHDRRFQLDTDVHLTRSERLNRRNDVDKSVEELQKKCSERLLELKTKRTNGLELARENERLLQETEAKGNLLIDDKESRLAEVKSKTEELAELLAVVKGKWDGWTK